MPAVQHGYLPAHWTFPVVLKASPGLSLRRTRSDLHTDAEFAGSNH